MKMYLVDFVATENVAREIELDLDSADNYEDAKELASKEIKQMYPELDNIEVVGVKEI